MSHGSHGGGEKLSRSEARIVFLLWFLTLVLAVFAAWKSMGEFLKEEPPKQTLCCQAAPKGEGEEGESGTHMNGWNQAYGALLLLHAHPLEAFEEGKKNPLVARTRVVLPLVWELIFAGFLAGLVIFRHRIWDYVRFTMRRPGVAIFGWGPAARSLAQAAAARKEAVVLVTGQAGDEMHAFGNMHGIPIVQDGFERHGCGGHNIRLAATLRLAWVHEIVFADSDDGRNIDNALAVAELAVRPGRTRWVSLVRNGWNGMIRVLLRRPVAWSAIRHVHVSDPILLRNIETGGLMERHRTIPFNWDEVRARHAIEIVDPLKERSLRSPHLAETALDASLPRFVPVHLVVLGDGTLARALVVAFVEAGQWSEEEAPHVTVIAKGAETLCRHLHGQRPDLGRCVRLESWDLDVPSPELSDRLSNLVGQAMERVVLAVAENDPRKAVSTALWLSRHPRSSSAEILLPCADDDGAFRVLSDLKEELRSARSQSQELESQLGSLGEDEGRKVKARKDEADRLRDTFHFTEKISVFGDPEAIRRHLFGEGFYDRAERRFREGAEIFQESYSGVRGSWKGLHPAFRLSSRCALRHVGHKLSSVGNPGASELHGCLERHMESLARLEHLRWNAERWLAGWRYDPVKSERERTSPYLVPWEQLDEKTREYDRISIQTIEAVLMSTSDGGGRRAKDSLG